MMIKSLAYLIALLLVMVSRERLVRYPALLALFFCCFTHCKSKFSISFAPVSLAKARGVLPLYGAQNEALLDEVSAF